MPMLELDDAQLHYRFDGPVQAPVLVLSNSLGTALSMWDGQIAMLTRRFRTLRYDTRGHGASVAMTSGATLDRLGRDVLALLDGLGVTRAYYCGLSLGGIVGIWLGVHAPDRVHKLVLCNTAARIGNTDTWSARIAAVQKGGMAAITPAVLERWFTASFRAGSTTAVERVRQMLLTTDAASYMAACEALRDTDLRESVSRVRADTLVIAGNADPATPAADGRWLAQHIAGARYVELPAAHLSNIEAEQRFNETVFEFLTT